MIVGVKKHKIPFTLEEDSDFEQVAKERNITFMNFHFILKNEFRSQSSEM